MIRTLLASGRPEEPPPDEVPPLPSGPRRDRPDDDLPPQGPLPDNQPARQPEPGVMPPHPSPV